MTGPNAPNEHVALTEPIVHPPGHPVELVLPLVVPGNVVGPHKAVATGRARQGLGTQLCVDGPNAPNEQVALTVPVHAPGHAVVLTVPWVVPGKVAAPHETVGIKAAAQGFGTQPSAKEKKTPLEHVALAVPVHPAGHITGLTLPLVVPGIVTAPHCAVEVDQAAQLRKQRSLTAI